MRSAAAKAGNPDPQGVALGLKRWSRKTAAQKREHALMMLKARKAKRGY